MKQKQKNPGLKYFCVEFQNYENRIKLSANFFNSDLPSTFPGPTQRIWPDRFSRSDINLLQTNKPSTQTSKVYIYRDFLPEK